MTNPIFVDANVPMYAVGTAHPLKQPCVDFLEAVALGEVVALTDAEVLQEILHRYSALNRREQAIEIVQLFTRIMPIVLPITLADLQQALDIHRQHPRLQARDSLHAAVMSNHGLRRILSADHHFDEVPELQRFDPTVWAELRAQP
jgi:hypothetical protein